jgi:hypothetical protein
MKSGRDIEIILDGRIIIVNGMVREDHIRK